MFPSASVGQDAWMSESDATTTDDLLSFFSGLHHWVADAGLSSEGAQRAAEVLEDFVETAQSAGYPPVDVEGPDPDSFPPPSNRIAAAATQSEGLLRGLDPAGWDAPVGDESVEALARRTRDELRSLATSRG